MHMACAANSRLGHVTSCQMLRACRWENKGELAEPLIVLRSKASPFAHRLLSPSLCSLIDEKSVPCNLRSKPWVNLHPRSIFDPPSPVARPSYDGTLTASLSPGSPAPHSLAHRKFYSRRCQPATSIKYAGLEVLVLCHHHHHIPNFHLTTVQPATPPPCIFQEGMTWVPSSPIFKRGTTWALPSPQP